MRGDITMKKFVKLSIVIFSLFLLSGILIAQKSQFGFGNSESNSKPEIAQGSSAAINFELKPVLFKGNPITDQYMVSYESEKNALMVQECDISPQAILPLGNSINVKSGEKTGFGIANPGIESAIFSYSALFEQRTGSYAWYINYNWTNFQTRLTNLGSQGFRIENIDTYGHNIFDYGGTWTTDGQGWAWILNYSNVADFISILNNWPLGLNRYRPIDFAIHPYLNSAQYYGAVAVEDNLGFSWAINYDQSPFKTWIANQWNSSRRLVELEMYQDPSSGNLKYAAISEDGTYAQTYWINLNWNTFISNHNSILTGVEG